MPLSGSETRASRYLRRSECTFTPCEGSMRYRSRSPLTRSNQEDEERRWSDRRPDPLSKPRQSKQESVFTAPLSFELQGSPVSTCKFDRDEVRASRYFHRSETTSRDGSKRYRSRSPLTRSNQEDEERRWSDRRPDPLSKPRQSKQESVFTAPLSFELQVSPVSTCNFDRDEVRASFRSETTSRDRRKRYRSRSPLTRSNQEDEERRWRDRSPEPLSKGYTGLSLPERKKRVCSSRPSLMKRKVEEHQDRRDDLTTSSLNAVEGSAVPSQKGHVAQKSKGDVQKTMPEQPLKESSLNLEQPLSCSTVQAQKESAEKAQSDQSDLHTIEGLPYIKGPKLGEGGFGTVYAGTRISDGLEVAIKFVSKESTDMVEDTQTGSMPLEVALMLRVSSDPACHNIVRLLDWFEQPKHFVMIMERPDPCEDLVTFYERYEDTDEEMAKAVIMQLISALKHCESRGVLHRDIKPENILVCTDTGEVKLLDFGCGDFLKNFYRTFAGTTLFAPPELFRFGRYQAGPLTVWSLGITMHEVLLGSIPYSTLEEITKQRLSLPNFLSKDCKHLLRWCLRKNPDLRPSLEEIQRHPWFQ